MSLPCSLYRGPFLNLNLYSRFLDAETSGKVFGYLLQAVDWQRPSQNKDGSTSRRRNKRIYGDPNLKSYKATIRDKEIVTEVLPWSKMPVLEHIKNTIRDLTGQEYHACVIQLYNNGETGINPHRDKEMAPGTIIASVSLGETRSMEFERSGENKVRLPLEAGSLCLINPPTNDHWSHSIAKDSTTGPRISLVFRNCANFLN